MSPQHSPRAPLPKRVSILGIPCDVHSSFKHGAAQAPPLIREALHNGASNLWAENGVSIGENDHLADLGDLPPLGAAEYMERIEVAVEASLAGGSRVIVLGGDHAVSYPVVRAYAGHYPNLNILHFDAHPDLYDKYKGNPHSHACPFARIMEERLATRLVQIGIRTANQHQREQAARFGVEMIEMRSWQGFCDLAFDGPLYISLDLDALDPAFAPGVSHREPGGLSVRELIGQIQRLHTPIAGADIVEYNPSQDIKGITATVAAKLLKEIAGQMLAV